MDSHRPCWKDDGKDSVSVLAAGWRPTSHIQSHHLSPESVLGEGHEIQSAVVLSSPIGATLPAGSKETGTAGAPMRELPYAACEGRFISKLFSASGSCHKLEGDELCAEQVKGPTITFAREQGGSFAPCLSLCCE